jgi:hypothetical protein
MHWRILEIFGVINSGVVGGAVLVEKTAEKILEKPDVPIALLFCLLIIGFLFYIVLRNYKTLDKLTQGLESHNVLLAKLYQMIEITNDAGNTSRDLIQRIEICTSNNTLQLNNLSTDFKSHRDECNRKIFSNLGTK